MATEQFTNGAQTTLAAPIDNSTTSLSVASAMAFPGAGNFRIRIDGELMVVTGVSGTTWTATRGAESTTAAAHSSGASVVQVLTAAVMNALAAVSADQSGNTVLAGPTSGGDAPPTFRALVTDDLPANGVTDAKLRDSAAASVIGRAAGPSGDPGDIAASRGAGPGSWRSGTPPIRSCGCRGPASRCSTGATWRSGTLRWPTAGAGPVCPGRAPIASCSGTSPPDRSRG